MTAFNDVFYSLLARNENPKFVTESTRTPLRELTIKKNLKFSTLEFAKICRFETTKQNICPSTDPFPSGRGKPSPHLAPFSALSPQL